MQSVPVYEFVSKHSYKGISYELIKDDEELLFASSASKKITFFLCGDDYSIEGMTTEEVLHHRVKEAVDMWESIRSLSKR